MSKIPIPNKVRAIAWILAAIAYLLFPADLIPDFIPVAGWIDDLLVMCLAIYMYRKEHPEMMSPGGARKKRSAPSSSSPRREPIEKDPYALLGLSRGARADEIKHAYREQMAQYHPDKVAHLGAELQRVAHERTLAIQEAYKTLMRGQE